MNAIVSVVGKDRTGIIAGVSTELAELKVNIEDISQTVLRNEYFTMIMLVSFEPPMTISALAAALKTVGEKLGVEVIVQHEDVFNSMHRV